MGWKVVCHRRARDNTSETRAKQSSPRCLVPGTDEDPTLAVILGADARGAKAASAVVRRFPRVRLSNGARMTPSSARERAR
jgi:hypothetical protein